MERRGFPRVLVLVSTTSSAQHGVVRVAWCCGSRAARAFVADPCESAAGDAMDSYQLRLNQHPCFVLDGEF